MADDEKIVYKLDLDAEAFMKTMNQVNERLGSIEKSAKTTELASMFEIAEVAVEAFKVALEVTKKVMEAVFEGENINAINAQFELLTKNAGIASEALRSGLEKAGAGLVDDTDLIQIANKAIVTMGNSAEKLPAILDASRRATAAFGGDLKNNFETFSMAVSTGNVRMLKQFGIVVDTEKAVREYAKSLGVTVSSLTEVEKKHALGNAALAQAKLKYKDVDLSIREAKDSFTKLGNAVNEAKETIQKMLSGTLGSTFKAAFDTAADAVNNLTARFKMVFSNDEAEKASNTIKVYESRLADLKEALKKNDEGGRGFFANLFGKNLEEERNEILQKIDSVQGVLDLQRERLQAAKKDESPSGKGGIDEEANAKRTAAQTKFETDLLTLKQQTVKARLDVETDALENEKLIKEQYDLAYQEQALQERAIDDQLKKGEIATVEQAEQMKFEIKEQYWAKVQELSRSEEELRLKSYENQVKAAHTASSGIAAGFAQGSAKATAEMNNFGKQGQRMFTNVTSHAKTAFIEMGKGQKSASEVAKGFVFGMMADEAEARGELVLASSIWPPNPLGIAAGGGLLALSGVLRSMGGGESGGAGVSGGAGSAGGQGPGSAMSDGPTPNQVAAPKKAVTIQIQGSYFETEATKQRLMEMIRDQTDATDFAYKQIGSK